MHGRTELTEEQRKELARKKAQIKRAEKKAYLQDLETKVFNAQTENTQLRQELKTELAFRKQLLDEKRIVLLKRKEELIKLIAEQGLFSQSSNEQTDDLAPKFDLK